MPYNGPIATLPQSDVTGPLNQISAAISWGDGQSSPGTITQVGTDLQVQGAHTYAAAGQYPLRVTVTGSDSAQVSGLETLTVAQTDIALAGATITPSLGQPFTGTVASFTDAYVGQTASSYTATITWGDGHNTPGVIQSNGTGGYNVTGTNTYNSAPATGTAKVQVVRSIDAATATADINVLVNAPVISLVGATITPSLGQTFTGTVATFNDPYPGLTASSYSAIITWGDGHNTPGTIQSNGTGAYNVIGTNTYTSAPATDATKVQVVRSIDSATASGSFTVLVNAPAAVTTFGGGLDPSSDTGVSSSDGITSINQPTFRGTAPAYSIVQLVARAQGQSQMVSLGQTVAGPDGTWTLTAMPMLDGIYQIFANVAPPTGFPVQVVPLSANNQIVIDTVGPSVVSVLPGRGQVRVQVSFQDQLSGLDLASLSDRTNYTLIGPHPGRITASGVTLVPSSTVLSNDPQLVSINARATFPVTGIRVVAGGVRDIAGNPLNGKYEGTLPSGGHPQGTSFLYHFGTPVSQTSPGARAQARRTSLLARRTARTWPR